MRSILAFFLALSVSISLAAAPAAGAQTENQLSPDDNKEREILRLTTLLNSGEAEVRLDTVIRLSSFRSPAAARALASASNDSSDEVRAAAIMGIGNCNEPSLTSVVAARLVADKSVLVRKCAAYALGKLKSDQSVAALTSALRDKDLEVRGAAVVALGEYEDPTAIGGLIVALSDKSDFVRERSARALGRYGRASASAVPTLIKLLATDTAPSVKLQAAIALGEIGDRSALPALETATHDKSPYVSRAATEALRAIARSK